MGWVETYLNNATVKQQLGVESSVKFASCNMDVNQGSSNRRTFLNSALIFTPVSAFFGQGDGMKNSAALVPELLQDGVRVLIYAGNAGESVS